MEAPNNLRALPVRHHSAFRGGLRDRVRASGAVIPFRGKADANSERNLAQETMRRNYFPNVSLTTHEGNVVRLYDDLIKDKVVLINFMYAASEGSCTRVTRNLAQVQKLLGDRMGRDIFIYSFTLDSDHDTPSVLKEYAERHQVGPGWFFLTGASSDLEKVRGRLGFINPNPILDQDKETHTCDVRYGNEARQLWSACQGVSNAEFIVAAISWVDWPKPTPEISTRSHLTPIVKERIADARRP